MAKIQNKAAADLPFERLIEKSGSEVAAVNLIVLYVGFVR